MPHSPLATSEILTHVTPRMFSPSIETIASVSFFDHLMLLFGIENILDHMSFNQWHLRSPLLTLPRGCEEAANMRAMGTNNF
jgi:hypothetical protein